MRNSEQATQKRDSGFTLVELIITLAVAGILVTIAVPSFMSLIASNRVTAASNELTTALNLAKSEAIRSGQNTMLCKINETGDGCNNAGKWSDGWLLFNDANGNDLLNDGEQIIRVHEAPEASLKFTFVHATAKNIVFRPNGTPNVSGRFCLQNGYQSTNSRAVLITQTGRIRTEVRDGANNNCDA